MTTIERSSTDRTSTGSQAGIRGMTGPEDVQLCGSLGHDQGHRSAILRLPKGKVQDWHNPARRQYVVILSGRTEVELTNGKKILLDPGRIVLFEDVTSKGHITRSIGLKI